MGDQTVLQVDQAEPQDQNRTGAHPINAVAPQVFVALCVYFLMAYLKFVSRSAYGVQAILRLLQMNLFIRRPVEEFLRKQKAEPPNPRTAFSLRFT